MQPLGSGNCLGILGAPKYKRRPQDFAARRTQCAPVGHCLRCVVDRCGQAAHAQLLGAKGHGGVLANLASAGRPVLATDGEALDGPPNGVCPVGTPGCGLNSRTLLNLGS